MMLPSEYQVGTPRHFHSSVTPGTTSLMSARTLASVSPRQSPSSLILPSISCDGDFSPFAVSVFFVGIDAEYVGGEEGWPRLYGPSMELSTKTVGSGTRSAALVHGAS